jgi:hypothetical protein
MGRPAERPEELFDGKGKLQVASAAA